MADETISQREKRELLDALDATRGNQIRIAAVLWTWLERHLHMLGSLRRKPHLIREDALKGEQFKSWDAAERRRIELAPLPASAQLLARIAVRFTARSTGGFQRARSVDGAPVYVMWRNRTVARCMTDGPPTADQPPSVTTLAPFLTVCPITTRHGIELSVRNFPTTRGGARAYAALASGFREGDPSLSVHLDALGDAGLTGLRPDEEAQVCWFDERAIDPDDEEACRQAATGAVDAAAGSPAVLVMPELAATSSVERAIRQRLAALSDEAPALTIVGLYHREPPPGEPAAVDAVLTGGAELARQVNEAIALAPDGTELWRHRKLSAAQAPLAVHDDVEDDDREDVETPADGAGEDDRPLFVEDTLPGWTLEIVSSPIGMIAILICLDSFAEHVRERLERSGADVVLVPSLSRTIHRHRTALQQAMQTLWGVAFVCNRAIKPLSEGGSRWNEHENRSFWVVPLKRLNFPRLEQGRNTSFVFRLRDAVAASAAEARRPKVGPRTQG
jgi:predicted amidohydrolase